MERRGAYRADRTAALSGVPKSTVHYWAREEILVPSISAERVKLWSYSDLMALRTIAWLRATKTSQDGQLVPATTMRAVRRALASLAQLDLELWQDDATPSVAVDRSGRIVIAAPDATVVPGGQEILDADMLDLLRPFELGRDVRGPDLVAPRPRLRIVPGKLAGAPHVHRTRIETEALGALARRGMQLAKIVALYPAIETADVEQALDLELQLQPDLAFVARGAWRSWRGSSRSIRTSPNRSPTRCRRTSKLVTTQRAADNPWDYLTTVAMRCGETADAIYRRERLSKAQLTRSPL